MTKFLGNSFCFKKIMKIVRSLLKNLANANPNIWGYVTL